MPNASQQADYLDAIVTAIRGSIGTASSATHKIVDANIVWTKHPLARSVATSPCCIVSPIQETLSSPTNASYDIGYSALVALRQAGNQELTDNADRLLYWRQMLLDLFVERRLTGASFVYLLKVEPRAVFDPGAWSANQDASLIVVRALVRRKNR